jgi:O-acetylhomoserine (thiol)-lyase
VADLEAIAALAHAHGLPLVVDNTFASPALCRPIEWGADVVVQSATKFVGGHGTVIAGAIVESGTFPWGAGRHPLLSEPSPGYHDLNFAETFGEYAFLMRVRTEVLRDVGASLSPMNAFMLLQGLETLPLRMRAHVENARAIATFLSERDEVAWINYAELESSPYRALARKYLPDGAGSIFTFGLRGGREAGRAFIEALELWSHLANVGDAKSLVIHPASTTHQQLSDLEMTTSGVTPDMVRLSVGLEDPADLIWDLENGLRAATAAAGARA